MSPFKVVVDALRVGSEWRKSPLPRLVGKRGGGTRTTIRTTAYRPLALRFERHSLQ